MRFKVLTDIGRKRTVNEDSAAVFTLPNGIMLAVIADGMGGHLGGDYASSTAVKVIGEQFMELDSSKFEAEGKWAQWLQEAVIYVNDLLYKHANENEAYKGMGTTLEAALIRGRSCLISHTGDSRVYAIDGQGVRQVTRDHSYVNVLLDSGEITEEEAAVHPRRNWIMKAVGSEKKLVPDLYSLELEDDMYMLICTDGLSNKVNQQSMSDIVLSTATLRDKTEELVDLANKMGGEDNISVILIDSSEVEATNP
ncbi:Stp1/IreP family PP2C-type Ser/Thr phosphatase [Sporosarcina sp. E16_3]|uniref:Stp1/IreP family PP2C-type Ser/Thr phosphatase n=1 Tax=Sporosarcina sp. E16_3 TaxID=2789293 RepID=UPI001A93469D|nr:Stp1/IreP family PP2C-type Ser/Thr phosphatase [Sporosarcina sp. E16_3]MBO0600977.1 Stp1/IreP family PP2C-type Ser/Thr phosphatase [Sporosarcina sp. E16_3]